MPECKCVVRCRRCTSPTSSVVLLRETADDSEAHARTRLDYGATPVPPFLVSGPYFLFSDTPQATCFMLQSGSYSVQHVACFEDIHTPKRPATQVRRFSAASKRLTAGLWLRHTLFVAQPKVACDDIIVAAPYDAVRMAPRRQATAKRMHVRPCHTEVMFWAPCVPCRPCLMVARKRSFQRGHAAKQRRSSVC